MALILNLETSTKNCSVSVSENGKQLVLCEEATSGNQNAEKIHQFIEWAFEGINYKIVDLDAVCVGKGPGSYTGLRVGVSAAKGICFALGIPLISLNSLHILAQDFSDEYDKIIPMIDAKRMEVYTALFNSKGEMLSSTEAIVLTPDTFHEFKDEKILILGDGAEKASEILTLENVSYQTKNLPSAKHMNILAYDKFINKKWEDTAYFEPFYLKDFVIGGKK